MSKIIIQGVELDINMLDADTAERVETAVEKVQKAANDLSQNKTIKLSEGIRSICHEVFNCFDNIFGEGTDKQIFGGHTDMGDCMEAFAQLVQQTEQDGKQRIDSITQKYLPNREIRRAAGRK